MKRLSLLTAMVMIIASPTAYGAIGQGTPSGAPEAVTGATATADFAGNTQTNVNVAWTPVPAGAAEGGAPVTGYQVLTYLSDSAGTKGASSAATCSVPATSNSCPVTGLAWATHYIFYVIATNALGTSQALATNVVGATNPASILTPGHDQTITMSDPPSPYTFGSADFQLTATATSGLPVTWSSSPMAVCTVDSTGVVHFLQAEQDCTITTTQNGASAGYNTATAFKVAKATISLSATATGASSLQGTAATLNGTFPYPGADVTPAFCISRTNPGASPPTTCSLPTGVVMGSVSLATVTGSTSTSVNAVVSKLNANTTYYYWAIARSGSTYYSSSPVTFSTLAGPTVTPSGSFTGSVGTAMSNTFAATDGTAPYVTWDHGTLPAGLIFSTTATTATISGTPTTTGTLTTWVSVQDSEGVDGSVSVIYTIGTAPSPTPTPGGGGGGGGGTPTPTPSPSASPTPSPTPTNSASPSPTPTPTSSPAPGPTTAPHNSPITPPPTVINLGRPVVITDNKEVPVSITPNPPYTGYIIKSGTKWNLEIASSIKMIKSNSTDSMARIAVDPGNNITSRGEGFKPNSQIDIYTFSDPQLLGTAMTDDKGSFITIWPMPASLETGNHIFQVIGTTTDNKVRTASVPLVILNSKPIVSKKKLTVYFDLNSAKLSLKYKKQLTAFAKSVRKSSEPNRKIQISVTGWVQPTKISTNTFQLSRARAVAVVLYLRALHLQAGYQITIAGFGLKNNPSWRKAVTIAAIR